MAGAQGEPSPRQEEQAETIAANENLGAPTPRAWARVSAAMAVEPRRSPACAWFASSLARLLGLGAQAQPTRIAGIATAAALVIVAEGAAIPALAPSRSDATYRTATEKPKEGTDVLIAFVPDARIGEISAFLKGATARSTRGREAACTGYGSGQTAVDRGNGSANQGTARCAHRTWRCRGATNHNRPIWPRSIRLKPGFRAVATRRLRAVIASEIIWPQRCGDRLTSRRFAAE